MTTAFITGGSRGLGFETAAALSRQGIKTVIFGKDSERLTKASRELNSSSYQIDLERLENIVPVFNQAISEHGVPDLLILAHGVMSDKMSKTLKTSLDHWRSVMAINLDSVFSIVNHVGAMMADRRSGRIIIFSACLGRMSGPGNAGGLAPYRISKAGVNALVRNLAHETGHGSRGLFVDAICPNHSRTDMGGPEAPRSAAEGAACAVWLATRELIPNETRTGLLWEDQEVIPW